MGKLFDRSLRTGVTSVLDSAYGASALENRLKGALASGLYDARQSSTRYNQSRTKTIDEERANYNQYLQMVKEGGDPNLLQNALGGRGGHQQDLAKARNATTAENRLVKELTNLDASKNPQDRYLSSGIKLGSNVQQTETGGLNRTKSSILRENENALTEAVGKVKSLGINTIIHPKLPNKKPRCSTARTLSIGWRCAWALRRCAWALRRGTPQEP